MPAWSDGFVNAAGLKIHYYRTGGNKPVVILNHGAGEDGLCWTRVARALETRYDVILPDARGHGRSDSGNGVYSTQARVADLAALIETLKLDRPIVGGHSLGADTALNFAVSHPKQTRAILLEDPPVYLPGETLTSGGKPVDQVKLGKQMITAMRLLKILPNAIKIPMLKKAQPGLPDEEIQPIANAQKRVRFDFISRVAQVANAISDPVERFGEVAVPVLLIIGDKEKMSIVSPEAAQRANQLNAQVEVVHLAGASHNIRRDCFEGYIAAVQNFLQTVVS